MDELSASEEDVSRSSSPNSFASMPLVERTGVTRFYKQSNEDFSTDEGIWQGPLSSRPPPLDRPLSIVRDNRTGKDVLTVRSPFLIDQIMEFVPRPEVLGITKKDHALSFPFPYSILFWYYDKIIETSTQRADQHHQAASDIRALKVWYERWVLPGHNEIRNTIKGGYVTFEHLWALFAPDDIVYQLDSFKQPRLAIVVAVAYRESMFEDLGLSLVMPGLKPKPGRLAIELWHQNYHATTGRFRRQSETLAIDTYTGSRRISDLSVYPLRYFDNGNQESIDGLRSALELRGKRWTEIICLSTTYLVHKGPATQLRQVDPSSPHMLLTRENVQNKYVSDQNYYAFRRTDLEISCLSFTIESWPTTLATCIAAPITCSPQQTM